MAVKAATIAGLPKPCEIREKCVRWRCILGSKICCGRELHKGDLSWFNKSISSFVTCLKTEKREIRIKNTYPQLFNWKRFIITKPSLRQKFWGCVHSLIPHWEGLLISGIIIIIIMIVISFSFHRFIARYLDFDLTAVPNNDHEP